jgi:hypothetical protein
MFNINKGFQIKILEYILLLSRQGAGREVVAHLVQASELVANLTKW